MGRATSAVTGSDVAVGGTGAASTERHDGTVEATKPRGRRRSDLLTPEERALPSRPDRIAERKTKLAGDAHQARSC